jgi:lysophospholipid acyltransferase (LPLAT)-like uncharacterized protein
MTVIGEDAYKKLEEQRKPIILLAWHGRIFLVPYYFRGKWIVALVSPSRDGEIPAQIMKRWKYKIIRGSGSHSMLKSWKEMLRELRAGKELIIVPDGPKGPNRRFKLGAVRLASQTGAHLVPFTFSTDRKKILSSWDHFLMFHPFSRVVVMFGEPLQVEPQLDEPALETVRKRMERIMHNLEKKADSYFQKPVR